MNSVDDKSCSIILQHECMFLRSIAKYTSLECMFIAQVYTDFLVVLLDMVLDLDVFLL